MAGAWGTTAITTATKDHGTAVAATASVLNKVGIGAVVGFTAAVVESSKKRPISSSRRHGSSRPRGSRRPT